jgi:hypothetical protein
VNGEEEVRTEVEVNGEEEVKTEVEVNGEEEVREELVNGEVEVREVTEEEVATIETVRTMMVSLSLETKKTEFKEQEVEEEESIEVEVEEEKEEVKEEVKEVEKEEIEVASNTEVELRLVPEMLRKKTRVERKLLSKPLLPNEISSSDDSIYNVDLTGIPNSIETLLTHGFEN